MFSHLYFPDIGLVIVCLLEADDKQDTVGEDKDVHSSVVECWHGGEGMA